MKELLIYISISVVMFLAGCSTGKSSAKNHSLEGWKNDFRRDENLAGVIVKQYPEGATPADPWINKHPHIIWYVFWNGDVRQVLYSPNGDIQDNSLWDGCLTVRPFLWKDVDFSYGSDPTFKKHKDPRESAISTQR